jgi:hypothetical protein
MSREKYEDYQEAIAACHACVVACNHCEASCLQEPDVKTMARCIGLDSDCAQICELAISYMAGGSEFVGRVCRVCAEVCDACAAECGRHDMDHCQQCAEACRRCAQACRAVIDV